MRFLITVALLVPIILAGCSTCAAPELRDFRILPNQMVRDLGSVWSVRCGKGRGTMAFVGKRDNSELLFLTAWHVVKPMSPMTATCWDGRALIGGRVIHAWKANDIALLAFPAPDHFQTLPLPIATERPRAGDRVIVPSYPAPTGEFFITEGRVSGPGNMSADVWPGSSGAPVLNDRGEVVGVVRAVVVWQNRPITWQARFQPLAPIAVRLRERIERQPAASHQER